MPQLDVSTFSSQIFWLLISFTLLFLMVRLVAMPRLEATTRGRANKIGGDISAAEVARATEKANDAAHAAAIEAAQVKARAALALAVDAARGRSAVALAKHDESLKAADAVAASSLTASRAAASAELATFASEAATDLVERLTGVKAKPARIAAAIEGNS